MFFLTLGQVNSRKNISGSTADNANDEVAAGRVVGAVHSLGPCAGNPISYFRSTRLNNAANVFLALGILHRRKFSTDLQCDPMSLYWIVVDSLKQPGLFSTCSGKVNQAPCESSLQSGVNNCLRMRLAILSVCGFCETSPECKRANHKHAHPGRRHA